MCVSVCLCACLCMWLFSLVFALRGSLGKGGAGLAPLGPLAEVCMLVFLCASSCVCVCVCMPMRFISFRVCVFLCSYLSSCLRVYVFVRVLGMIFGSFLIKRRSIFD